MSISQNQRRRGRSGGSGVPAGREKASGSSSDTDALAGLRQAVADLDPGAFARHFSEDGWVRVPRPEGDVVLRGPKEIEQLGHELRQLLIDLTWTPSQRFVAAGQVVEEAVAWARTAPGAGLWGPAGDDPDGEPGEIRVPMRVVAALDPAGGIGSLTLWIDWAALHDPLGVDSARGAASALVAQARARDARGLRVIESEPGTAPLPVPVMPVPVPRAPGPTRPPAAALWWKQHRATLGGSVMALAAAAVIGWVAVSALRPILDGTSASGPTPTAGPSVLAKAGTNPTAPASTTLPGKNEVPKITKPQRSTVPEVQPGEPVELQSALLFQTNSFKLTDYAQNRLQGIADRIRDEKMTGNIQVNGYTDDRGSEASNKTLSENRAEAVATALAPKLLGLPVKLSVQGFGETAADYDNRTTAGRKMNRKVVIVLPNPLLSGSASPSPSASK